MYIFEVNECPVFTYIFLSQEVPDYGKVFYQYRSRYY